MRIHWQLQEAKNRLSRVIQQALQEGPQTITVRGKEAVVILSVEEYRKLTRPKSRLTDFFRQSPLVGIDLDLARSREPARDIAL